jgi:hypothetical protein
VAIVARLPGGERDGWHPPRGGGARDQPGRCGSFEPGISPLPAERDRYLAGKLAAGWFDSPVPVTIVANTEVICL